MGRKPVCHGRSSTGIGPARQEVGRLWQIPDGGAAKLAAAVCGRTSRFKAIRNPTIVLYSAAMHRQANYRLASLLLLLVLIGSPVRAADVEPIQRAITDFLAVQVKNLPGQARYKIGPINAGALPAGCSNIAVTMDAGARQWGKTHVNVRCTEGSAWKLYVPVQINVAVDYLVSARPLSAGQLIGDGDIVRRQGDLADLPPGILTDPVQALGQTSTASLPADRPLRADMLRLPTVVKQGQSVKLVSGGAGFQVASEGRALGNATAGQVVQVRLGSGQVVSGIARSDGTVGIAN